MAKPIFRTEAELESIGPNLYEALRLSEKSPEESGPGTTGFVTSTTRRTAQQR